MAMPLDRTGTFRVRPLECGLKNYKSGAVSVSIRFQILAQQDQGVEGGWVDWSVYAPVEQYGFFFIVKKNGQLNEPTARNLIEALGWSGDLNDFVIPNVRYDDCQIVVQEDEYNGNVTFKVQWINTFDYEGGMDSMDSSEVKLLQAKHGASLRAIAGNAKLNGTAPKPQPAPELVGAAADGPPPPSDADVPFE